MVVLSDSTISGIEIEIKSGSDTLDRLRDQMHAYGHAFDATLVVADEMHLAAMQEGELRSIGSRARFYRPASDIFVSHYGAPYASVLHPNGAGGCRSYQTSTVAMAHLMWQSEAAIARGLAKATRASCMRWMHENMALRDCRTAVVGALRARVLNAWEISFWQKFDAFSASQPVNGA
jgi:hypothetical protein